MDAVMAKIKNKSDAPVAKAAKAPKAAKASKPKIAAGFPEPAATMGRPPAYQPKFSDIARGMAKLGATDFEIAEELGVATSTV
jgi:hypothetical protein